MLALPVVLGVARAPLARAQTTRTDSVWLLDSRVVQVVSGGSWSKGDSSGQYRVIVRAEGVDTVHYAAVVQWMVRRGLSQDLQLVHTVNIGAVGKHWYSTLDPELRPWRGRWLLTLDAADAPLRAANHRAHFVLGPPGEIRVR